jgi:hypothetical protein
MPFMYSLHKSADLSDHGNALASGPAEALVQIRAYRRANNMPDVPFAMSDDPSEYFLEQRKAVPSRHGPGWTNDPRGPVEVLFVSAP